MNNLTASISIDPGSTACGSSLAASLVHASPAGHLDEMWSDRSEGFTPHWQQFFDLLGPEGLGDLNRRQQSVVSQLRDNGVTYNIYADENGMQRPWSLDLFPLIIPPRDWAAIEAGVLQRTRLLNQILGDIYGPRKLLEEVLLPPALVQGHPGYMRAMQGVRPPGDTWLHVAAFDLAHGPNGHWWVVSNRTQAPSGLGYLLENRTAIARQFPAAFSAMKIQQVGESYKALMQGLQALSPQGANACIAVLTPGPYNETYFEHAYLARYLGLTLVEGKDLTVRDQRVYLKTLDGLEPVDVLIKRLDDEWLDPLELRADSALGVPGLMQAVRAGNVLLANAPGSAPLESSALLGFLPAICERLLGEPLQLPSLDTWWCGEAASLPSALPMVGKSVIKHNYGGPHGQTVIGPTLDAVGVEQLTQRILHRPDEHTLQAYLPLSHQPTWRDGAIAPRAAMLRVFALADGANSWRVLPGGLVRLAPRGQLIASMQSGGSSADCWVQATKQTDATSLSHNTANALNLGQQRPVITSRAAENLFWLGRYTERAENSVRQASLTLRCLESVEQNNTTLRTWLGANALEQGLVEPDTPGPETNARSFQHDLVATLNAASGATSVGYNLRALRQAANQVPERLAQDHRVLIERADNEFTAHYTGMQPGTENATQKALETLAEASELLTAITRIQTDSMVRDDGWRMLSIGRNLERLHTLAQSFLLAVETRSLYNDNGLKALLELFDSADAFHAQYQQRRDLIALLDVLFFNQDNPRSLGCVVTTLRSLLSRLPQRTGDDLLMVLPDANKWNLATVFGAGTPACEADSGQAIESLQKWLRELVQAVTSLSDSLALRYFNHAAGVNTSLVS